MSELANVRAKLIETEARAMAARTLVAGVLIGVALLILGALVYGRYALEAKPSISGLVGWAVFLVIVIAAGLWDIREAGENARRAYFTGRTDVPRG